jgi:hypothetical protein
VTCIVASIAIQAHAQVLPAPANFSVGLLPEAQGPGQGAGAVRGNAWKMLAAYQFNHHFGFEAGYRDLGRYDFASRLAGLSAAGDVRMRAWTLAGTGYLPLNRSWSLSGKVGLGSNATDFSRTNGLSGLPAGIGSAANGRADVMLGLGLGYSLGAGIGLRFDYENFGAAGAGKEAAKSDNWAVSLKYSF